VTDTVRPSPISFAAWVAVALGIVWLIALGGGFYGIYAAELRLVSVVMTAAALAAWAVVAIRDPSWRPRSAIWPALAVPLAAFAVTTALSERPRISVEYLAYSVLLAALYLLLRALLAHAAFRDRITGLTVLLAFGMGIAYVVACVGHWIDWWDAVGALRVPPLRPLFESLTYGNPSAIMTMSVLLTGPAVAHLGIATRGRRVVVIALIVLAGVVTLLSGSRSGWLAVAVAILVVAVAVLASPGGRMTIGRAVKTRRARLVGAAVLVAAVGIGLALMPAILMRAGAAGADWRAGYVAVAGRMFASAPVTGVGAGTWVADRIALTEPDETDYYIPHAHNLYAQTAAEHGILGLAAGALAVACVAWLVLGALRDPDAVRRRWGWVALFTGVYFAAHNMLDFYANFPATLFAFALPIAWLDATAARSILVWPRAPAFGSRARRAIGIVGALAGAAVITAAVAGLVRQETPARAMADGMRAAAREDWSAALPLFESAAEADPEVPSYAFARGLAEARAGDQSAALATLLRVAQAEDLPVAWLDVAALRLDAGDTAGATEAIERALRLGRQQPAILFGAGALMERLGDASGADAAWVSTLQYVPSLAGDPWWNNPVRAGRWPGIRDAALASMSGEGAVNLWLSSGDTEQAAQVAAQIADPTSRERSILAVAAWDGDAAAREALDAYARDHPFDLAAVAWAGRVAARAGDRDALEDYRLWGNTVGGGYFGVVGEVRLAVEGMTGARTGLTGTFWGQYTYRRATPEDQLVPSLPHLVLTP
jgi:O-antigen ligase